MTWHVYIFNQHGVVHCTYASETQAKLDFDCACDIPNAHAATIYGPEGFVNMWVRP